MLEKSLRHNLEKGSNFCIKSALGEVVIARNEYICPSKISMSVDLDAYNLLAEKLKSFQATLVAVSKTKPVSDIRQLYDHGHRDFGENYVNELLEKQKLLPQDIRWHFIGHLQTNKVRSILPFIHLIHGVDSFRLLKEINKEALKQQRTVNCLLQVHIADEETKFGLTFDEAEALLRLPETTGLANVAVQGLMGMATLTADEGKIRNEFRSLKSFFQKISSQQLPIDFRILS